LLTASGVSSLTLEGGTHNPFAPPFDFLERSFVPLIRRMGPKVDLNLRRPGFFPAGGGRVEARIEPVHRLARLDLAERGPIRAHRARAWVSKLPSSVGERELATVRQELGWQPEDCRVEIVANPAGPGNALVLELEAEHVTGVFTGFGERGRAAEDVAREVVAEARLWLEAEVPVSDYLADQLLLPMALAGGGSFRTVEPSPHAKTNAAIIQRFLAVATRFEHDGDAGWRVVIGGH
jgi:RNA 3'-terminal phosphate cyclase (ATP)